MAIKEITTISSEMFQSKFKEKLKDIKHFSPFEYLYDNTYKHWTAIDYFSDVNREIDRLCFMLKPLLLKLDQVRKAFDSPVIITNGVRDYLLWNTLYSHNYSVSLTTDHSYGTKYNLLGVGAMDHYCMDVPVEELYAYEKVKFKDDIGQLIMYRDKKFCHLSNRRELVYSAKFIKDNFKQYSQFLIL